MKTEAELDLQAEIDEYKRLCDALYASTTLEEFVGAMVALRMQRVSTDDTGYNAALAQVASETLRVMRIARQKQC